MRTIFLRSQQKFQSSHNKTTRKIDEECRSIGSRTCRFENVKSYFIELKSNSMFIRMQNIQNVLSQELQLNAIFDKHSLLFAILWASTKYALLSCKHSAQYAAELWIESCQYDRLVANCTDNVRKQGDNCYSVFFIYTRQFFIYSPPINTWIFYAKNKLLQRSPSPRSVHRVST